MKTALVTGGAGFLGLQLVRRLQDEGVAVRILDREPPDETWLAWPADFVEGDIRDPSVVTRAVREDVEVVFHLAAVLPVAKAGPDLRRGQRLRDPFAPRGLSAEPGPPGRVRLQQCRLRDSPALSGHRRDALPAPGRLRPIEGPG